MSSENWMELFFGKTKKENIQSDKQLKIKEAQENLIKNIKIYNNKCYRKLLESLYSRIFIIKFLFDECVHKGRNTIIFNDLKFTELNSQISKCDVWIDKIGKQFRWKISNAITNLNKIKEFINSIYDINDDEYNIIHFSAIGNLLSIDLKAIVFKSTQINTMVHDSKLLMQDELIIKLHKYISEIVHLTDNYYNSIAESYHKISEELEIDIDKKYIIIHDKLEKLANMNLVIRNSKDEIKKYLEN